MNTTDTQPKAVRPAEVTQELSGTIAREFIQCADETGNVGDYLATNAGRRVSPTFRNLGDLYTWANENDWISEGGARVYRPRATPLHLKEIVKKFRYDLCSPEAQKLTDALNLSFQKELKTATERDRLREQVSELLAACKRVLDVITGDQAAELGIYDAIRSAEGRSNE